MVSQKTCISTGIGYITCLYTLELYKSPYQGSQRTFPFHPISSFSNTCSIWNSINFFQTEKFLSCECKGPFCTIHLSVSGCHSHISPEISCWYQLSFILPTQLLCSQNSLFGTNQRIMEHDKLLAYFS